MRVGLWLIAVLIGLGLVVQVIKVRGSKDEQAAIRHVIRASLGDFQRRDPHALCDDFTPTVDARLGGGPASSCAANVARLFSSTSGQELVGGPHPREPPWRLRVTHIRWRGDRATAVSVFVGRPASQRHWTLRMLGGRWRIETPTELQVRTDCRHDLEGQPGCTRLLAMREARR